MNSPANTRLIGLFVLGGLTLASVLVLMFGGGNYFSRSERYVAYFEGSVNGLNTGAAVKLKGVSIGRVVEVLVQYDMEHDRALTPVVAEINLEKIMETYGADSERHEHPSLQNLIDHGLRARLSVLSLVTNQLFMDLEFQPDQPGNLTGLKSMGLQEMPTIPSGKDEIEKTVQQVTKELRELPLKDTVAATLGAVRRIDYLLAKPETDASITNLNQTLKDMQRLIRHLDSKVDAMADPVGHAAVDLRKLVGHLDQSIGTLTTSLEGATQDSRQLISHLNQQIPPLLGSATQSFLQAQQTLSAVEEMTQPDSEVASALQEMSEAARSIRRLADTLERNPDNLLYGRKKQEENR